MAIRLQEYSQSYFASCAVGLEEILSKEFQSLGAKKVTLNRGGIDFKGTEVEALKGVLYSRTASRIYKKIYSFPVVSEKDIYNGGMQIPWYKFMSVDKTFKIKTLLGYGVQSASQDAFKNSLYLSQLLKDSIADYFKKLSGRRPNVDLEKADMNILLRIAPLKKGDTSVIATLFLDISGHPLHQRAYRLDGGKAPIKENTAAGIIMMMNWKPEEEIFMDSMCGSGTFLVEAALIKGDIPPSFLKALRNRDSIHSDLRDAFEKELSTYKQKISDGFNKLRNNKITIYGSDMDNNSLTICAKNVEAAGLQDVIKIKKVDAIKLTPPAEQKGVIFCNAPYGERVGDVKVLEELYYEYGENLKNNFKGYTAYILTGSPELQKKVALKPERKIPVYNGKIDCRLLKYSLY